MLLARHARESTKINVLLVLMESISLVLNARLAQHLARNARTPRRNVTHAQQDLPYEELLAVILPA